MVHKLHPKLPPLFSHILSFWTLLMEYSYQRDISIHINTFCQARENPSIMILILPDSSQQTAPTTDRHKHTHTRTHSHTQIQKDVLLVCFQWWHHKEKKPKTFWSAKLTGRCKLWYKKYAIIVKYNNIIQCRRTWKVLDQKKNYPDSWSACITRRAPLDGI